MKISAVAEKSSRGRKLYAVAALGHALLLARARWRGHPESPFSLYGLLWSDDPWAVPRLLYRVPSLPLRMYIRTGDALLFRLWWYSRAPLEALVRAADPSYFDTVHVLRGSKDEAYRDAMNAPVEEQEQWTGDRWVAP